MRKLLLPLIALLVAGVGCARVDNSSVVHPDGSVDRTLVVAVNNSMGPGGEGQEKVMPKSLLTLSPSANWKSEEGQNTQGEDIVTSTMKLAPGQSITDEFVVSDGSDAKASCTTKAEKLADGSVVYTETWTWKGKADEAGSPLAKLEPVMKEKLSAKGISEADQKSMTASTMRVAWRAIFGPGEPLLPMMMTDPNLAIRKLNNRIAKQLIDDLGKAAPAMPGEEKLAVAREVLAGLDMSQMADPAANAPTPDEGGKQDLMVSILSRVKGPGVLVESDGELDLIESEVFWSMYLEACTYEPVVLRAVFKP